ncbi:MAG: SAM-dependent methyltransferase [Proteobacteria bacterium]|nr:SAM-dependent methyltransferase [Pseudomonadota bacterium]MDA1354772.1 SAM-dependent methyltransferase [Pseudomonadota bacterium]
MSRYMEICLSDPEHGYYRRREPIGAAGDFITAPEVSQMFGELIGLWCAVTWRQMGAPSRINLVELGPGRGSLMQDALRAVRAEPEFCRAFSLHLVETGDRLRDAQRQRLVGAPAAWHLSLDTVPPGPLLLIANEFFDALPVHQYEMTAEGWRERLVTFRDGACRLQLAALPCALNRLGKSGDVFEQAPARNTYMADIAARLERYGGAALIIDYGHGESANGDTLQAVRAHRAQSIFAEPGLADLTSHVDFEALGRAASGVSLHGPVRQCEFLQRLGIEARAATLQRSATPEQGHEIATALHRLLDTRQMGDLFKVLAVTQTDAPVPAGLERSAAALRVSPGGTGTW